MGFLPSVGYDLFAPKSSIWAVDFDGSNDEFERQAADGTNSVGTDRQSLCSFLQHLEHAKCPFMHCNITKKKKTKLL